MAAHCSTVRDGEFDGRPPQRQSAFAVSANTTAATGIAQPMPNADAVNLNATYMAQMATSIPKTRRTSGIWKPLNGPSFC